MRRKSSHHITVSRGVLTATGATKSEAKAELEKQIDWALSDGRDPFLEFRFGCILSAVAEPHGWSYGVVFPDAQKHGAGYRPSCSTGPESRATIIAAVRRHACDSTWTPETDDAAHAAASGLDERGQADLMRAFAWKRAYMAAKEKGHTDGDAHEIASGIRRAA